MEWNVLKPVAVKALAGYKIWIKYEDGVEGEINLSDLAGRGIFKIWQEPGVFEKVTIGKSGAVKWSDDVELCPDALYLKLTGKQPEEIFPNRKKSGIDA